MKKLKRFFKFTSIAAIALTLVLSAVNFRVFALTSDNNAEVVQNENIDGNIDASSAMDADVEDIQAVEDVPAVAVQGNKAMLRSGQSGFATFDGLDLATNTNIEISGSATDLTPKKMIIKAAFPTDADVTNPKVDIKINNLLQLYSAPGMEANGTSLWKLNTTLLPSDLKPYVVSATFTPDAKVNGQFPNTGTLTYEFIAGTASASLDLLFVTNHNYSVSADEKAVVRSNPVVITTSYQKAGSPMTGITAAIDQLTITAGTSNSIGFAGTIDQSQYKLVGESGILSYYIYTMRNTGIERDAVYKKLDYVFEVQKAIGIQNVTSTQGFSFTYTIDRSSSSTVDYVHTSFQNVALTSLTYLNFNYTVPNDALKGSYVQPKAISLSVTTLDDVTTTTNNPSTGYNMAPKVIIMDSRDETLTPVVDNQSFSFQELNKSDYLLGSYQVANQTGVTLTSQSGQLDFSAADGSIGVESVLFTVGAGVGVKNITAVSNLGNTYTVAQASKVRGADGFDYLYVDKTMLEISNTNEYIQMLTWDYNGSFNENYGASNQYSRGDLASIRFYGKALTIPDSKQYSTELTLAKTGTAFTDASAKSKRGVINIASQAQVFFYVVDASVNKTYLAGESYQNTVMFYPNTASNFTGEVNNLKGVSVYLRDDEYLLIDSSSISVTYNSVTYGVADGLTITQGVDNTNHTFYRIDLPEAELGINPSTAQHKDVKVNYGFSVRKNAPTTTVLNYKLTQMMAYDTNITVISGSKNTYNVTGSGNLNQLLGTAGSKDSIKLQAQKALVATTAVNLDGGPWTTYDYKTEKTVLDLDTKGTTRYQLALSNNSGYSATGFVALVPIPKAGEQTPLTPSTVADFDATTHLQQEAFAWTASILEPVDTSSASLSYQVLYATTYEINKDSSNFKPWNQIADKNEIRMVKIFTTDAIPDGSNDSVDFALALSDPNAGAHTGLSNIYSSRIYRDIDATAGYLPSEPVAIRLVTGMVKGVVFNDTNRNGLQDVGEIGQNGVSVIAYLAGTTTEVDRTTTKTINNVVGSYELNALNKGELVDIVFLNPSTDDSLRFSNVINGGSTPSESTDHKQATTSNVNPSNNGYDKVHAGLITPTTLTLDATTNGGTTAITTMKLYPNDKIATQPVASKTGYTFQGWFTQSSGGTQVTFPYTGGTIDVTLYAQFSIAQYEATFDIATNGGQGTAPAKQTVNYGTLLIEPADAVKPGYTFKGWYQAASPAISDAAWDFSTKVMPANNVTLYAVFSASDQTITFDVNGGNAAMKPADIIQPTDSSVNLGTVTPPTRAGYGFVGWFTSSDVQYSGTITMPAGGLNLIAKWVAGDQVISFDTNGGSGVDSITAPTDASVDISNLITTRAGYQFDGWFVGNTEYSGTITMPAGGLTLKAKWTALNQTITFDSNGGSAIESIIAVTDSMIDLDAAGTPIWFGHRFLGWQTAEKTAYSGTLLMPAGGLHLIAQWQDLIIDGIWMLEAQDVYITVDQLKIFINNGTLEEDILSLANARAWDSETNEVLSPLHAEVSAMLQAASVGEYAVTIHHSDSDTMTTMEESSEQTGLLSTDITVYVFDDSETSGGLPVTGSNESAMAAIGTLIIAGSGILILLNKKRK